MSNMKRSATMDKVKRFCKKQGYYILLALCILMVATIITMSVVLSNKQDIPTANVPGGDDTPSGGNPTPDPNPTPDTKYFTLPMQNDYQVYNGNVIGDKFQSVCYGLMFDVESSDKVLSSGEGKVLSNDLANKVLKVQYPEKNVVIVYKGLSYTTGNAKNLKAGDIVIANQVLGEASGVYNYNANYLNAVHVDVFDMATNKRVANYDNIFDIVEK